MTPIEITEEDFEDMNWGKNWEAVEKEEITSQSRWTTYYKQVFKKLEDGTFWEVNWAQPSTEYQEADLDATMVEVVPKEVTTTIYVVK